MTPTAQTKVNNFPRKGPSRVELPGHTDDTETHQKAAARREPARTGARPRTYLDDRGVLRECVLSFRGLTHGDVLDVTSPENDVLVNLLSRRGRPVCGTVFSTEGPHLGWRKTVTPSSSAKSLPPILSSRSSRESQETSGLGSDFCISTTPTISQGKGLQDPSRQSSRKF